MAALDKLFDLMLQTGASDLHLSPGYPAMLRNKGKLEPANDTVLQIPDLETLMFELLEDDQLASFLHAGDLDFAYAYEDKARFRANYLAKHTGPGAVFRTIPSKILSAEDLHLPESVVRLAERPAGLVLVTGPTGSGKSTTLAALIRHINATRPVHILTIEDPVEFVHEPIKAQVTHREVGRDTPSFSDAMRSAGRENADVILVGELRGAETMRMALQSASFGILVLATVHTNSAAATIDRFVNAFPSNQQQSIRGLLSESLAGVVSQQLVATADKTGRVAAHEVMMASSGIAAAIREARPSMINNLIQSSGAEGMQTMDAALERLVVAGTVTAEAALEKALDKDSFARAANIAPLLKAQAHS